MSEPTAKNRHVVMTGATRGIGRAMAEAILVADETVRIINIGRSTHDDVVQALGEDHRFGNVRSGKRISYLGNVDLADPECLQGAIRVAITDISDDMGGKIIGMIHCAGQAAGDGSDQVDNMKAVNTEAAIKIGEAIKASGLSVDDFRYLYVSSLAAHPNGAEVPQLHSYGDSKKAAVGKLKGIFGEQLAVVYPGVFDTDMVDAFFTDLETAMEFYGAPMADASPDHPLSVETAETILGKRKMSDIVHPKLSRNYVNMAGPRLQKLLLPLLVSLFAKHNLALTDQSKWDHLARVQHHQDNENYGKNPLVYMAMKHLLMPAKVGELLQKLFKKIGWL